MWKLYARGNLKRRSHSGCLKLPIREKSAFLRHHQPIVDLDFASTRSRYNSYAQSSYGIAARLTIDDNTTTAPPHFARSTHCLLADGIRLAGLTYYSLRLAHYMRTAVSCRRS